MRQWEVADPLHCLLGSGAGNRAKGMLEAENLFFVIRHTKMESVDLKVYGTLRVWLM